MPQPNVQQGSGRLRRRGRERAAREAYLRQQANTRSDAQQAVNRERAEYRPGGSSSGGSAPAQPKYGPAMTRARADADLVYGDAILRAKAGVQNAGSWWDQYKQDVANQQQAAAQRYQQAQAAVAQSAPTVGPAVQTPEGDQAAASRGVVQQAFGNLLTSQGAATQDYFGGRLTVGSAQQLQSRLQADAEVQRLARERDSYTVQQRGRYRDQAHTQRLENKAFGLDVAQAQADVADDLADNRRANRQARLNRQAQRNNQARSEAARGRQVNKYGFSNAEWEAMSTQDRQRVIRRFDATGVGGKNPYSAKDQSKARQDFRKAYGAIRENDNGLESYGADIQRGLVGGGLDPLLARAAWQLYKKGRVSSGVAKAMFRDYGIRVKPRNPRQRPEPSTPFPDDSPGSDAAQG